MSDVMPDYHVEQQKLVVQIMTLQTNLARVQLEVMQLDSRKKNALANIEASRAAIAEAKERQKGLEDTHGKMESFPE